MDHRALIVGRRAMRYHGYPVRKPTDLDLWIPESAVYTKDDYRRIDLAIVPDWLIDNMQRDPMDSTYPSLNTLYTLKISHLGWDIQWQKHKRDALWLKLNKGAKLNETLYLALKSYWVSKHGNKDFLSLNQNKTDFFTDAVEYVYDHDYLHELAAYPNPPMYNRVLKDGQDVLIDHEKFKNTLSFFEKVKLFREEMTVIACERWLINPTLRGKVRWTQAWQYSLRKTATTLTKNWATDFIVQNLEHFDRPDFEDFRHLFTTLDIGAMNMKEIPMEKIYEIVEEVCSSDPYYEDSFCSLHEFVEGDVPEGVKDYEHIQQEGGGEGGSEFCYCVFRYKGQHYMIHYNYYSHHGLDFGDAAAFLVEPTIVEVVKYV